MFQQTPPVKVPVAVAVAGLDARPELPTIVLFGDSITEGSFDVGGWGARLAHEYARKADVVNRGQRL
jgi:hypothetical protein